MTNNPNSTVAEKLAALTGVNIKDVARTLDFYGRPYRVYTALLSQDGTSAPPTSIVLENTLETLPVFEYVGTGAYNMSIDQTIDRNKIWLIINPNTVDGMTASYSFSECYVGSISNGRTQITINTGSSGAYTDGLLNNTSFELRVYN